MTCLDRLEGYLREHRVAFEVQHHHRTVTAGETAASEHLPPYMLAKVVLVMADKQLVMLVVPASDRVYLQQVARIAGAQSVRLATEGEFAAAFPDCELGGMPPFGHLYGMPVYVDRALADDPLIVFQAGTHTETMSMLYSDFVRLVQPVLGDFTYRTYRVPVPVG